MNLQEKWADYDIWMNLVRTHREHPTPDFVFVQYLQDIMKWLFETGIEPD